MSVSFTGSRNGLTPEQKSTLEKFLELFTEHDVFYHNDGEGADKEFHNICVKKRFSVVVHDGDADVGAMARNRSLVQHCKYLIGCPPTDFIIKKGSGTWETLKYGWKYGKRVIIIQPNGMLAWCDTKELYKEFLNK